MSDYIYVQDFVYDTSDDLINNSIFGGSLVDGDNDDQFEAGDQLFGVHDYAGTITVDGIIMPVFLRSDGNHHVYNPGPGHVTPPATLPAITAQPFAFCFASDTLITCPNGLKRVDELTIGDMICTAAGAVVPVKWIGRQTVLSGFAGPKMQPVRIRAGALGAGVPMNDLTVTADHGMIMDGFVINASALVNGSTIDFVPLSELPNAVTYYHIETDAHDVILANGAAAETFVDATGRKGFDNYAEYIDLYGAERVIFEMHHSRISARRLLPRAIKARLGITDALHTQTSQTG